MGISELNRVFPLLLYAHLTQTKRTFNICKYGKQKLCGISKTVHNEATTFGIRH